MAYIGTKPADAALTSADIADGVVTAAKLATDSVETAKVKNLNVTNAKIAASTIDVTAKITGTMPTANLGSGTASSTTILYGDQTYKTEPAEYNDTAIRNDLMTVALKQASQENMTKHNLPHAAIVVFQADADFDLAGSTNITRNASEYIYTFTPETWGSLTNFVANNWDAGNTGFSFGDGTAEKSHSPDIDAKAITDGSATTPITFAASTPFQVTGTASSAASNGPSLNFVPTSLVPAGSPDNSDSDWYWGFLAKQLASVSFGMGGATGQVYYGDGSAITSVANSSDFSFNPGQFTITRDTLGVFRVYQGTSSGTLILTSTSTTPTLTSTVEYTLAFGGSGTGQADIESFQHSSGTASSVSATGTALGTTNVPSSAVTQVSGVFLMKNAYGTNTLGTDVKVYFTADNSNWTEASSYTSAGTFSTGVTQITLGKTTVTSGSDVRWKIVFANQAAASKEAYIYGIGTNY